MAQGDASNTTAENGSVNLSGKPAVEFALRDAGVLTTSYVASDHMPVTGAASAGVVLTCASVDYTSIETLVQGSTDASTWIDIPSSYAATSVGAHAQTLANLSSATSGAYLIEFPVTSSSVLYVRVQVKRTGGTATGTVAIAGRMGAQR